MNKRINKIKKLKEILTEYYKLKRCSKKECCKQCRHVKFKGTMTERPVQKLTHIKTHRTPRRNRHLEKNIACLISLHLHRCVLVEHACVCWHYT